MLNHKYFIKEFGIYLLKTDMYSPLPAGVGILLEKETVSVLYGFIVTLREPLSKCLKICSQILPGTLV